MVQVQDEAEVRVVEIISKCPLVSAAGAGTYQNLSTPVAVKPARQRAYAKSICNIFF